MNFSLILKGVELILMENIVILCFRFAIVQYNRVKPVNVHLVDIIVAHLLLYSLEYSHQTVYLHTVLCI